MDFLKSCSLSAKLLLKRLLELRFLSRRRLGVRDEGFEARPGRPPKLSLAEQEQAVEMVAEESRSIKRAVADGLGIRNTRFTLTEADGTTRTALTGAFGYYRFEEVEVGQTVVISISSKRFVFSQSTQILNVTEDANEVNFVSDK